MPLKGENTTESNPTLEHAVSIASFCRAVVFTTILSVSTCAQATCDVRGQCGAERVGGGGDGGGQGKGEHASGVKVRVSGVSVRM